MTMKRRAHLPILLVAGLVAGCGGEGDRDEQAPAASPPTTADQPATTTPQQGAAPTVDAAALPEGVTQEMVQQGQEIFAGQGICFTCHGQNGSGSALAPALNDGQWLWVEGDQDLYEQLVTIIRTGVARPMEYPAPMPPMGGAQLNEDQIRSVAAYVYALNQNGGA